MIIIYQKEYWCNVCGIKAVPDPHFYLRILCPKCQSNRDISNDLFGNSKKVEEIILVAKALADKLNLIEKDGRCAGIFIFAANHGLIYDGPNYSQELKDLQEILNEYI